MVIKRLLEKCCARRGFCSVDRFESFLNKIQDLFKDYCKYKSVCQYFDPTNFTCTNNEGSYCGKHRYFKSEKTLNEVTKKKQRGSIIL